MYSREQIKRLEEMGAPNHFYTTIQSGFKRGTPLNYDNEIADIYEAATGTKVDRGFTCKSCCYAFYKKAATLYYDTKKYYDAKDKEKEEKEAAKEITDFVEDVITTDQKLKAKKKTTSNKKKTTKNK